MASITQADFEFYKNKLFKDKDLHTKEFLQRINPDKIDAYYEGDPEKEEENNLKKPGRISLNRLFVSTMTLIAQFYPQNHGFIGIPKREGDELSAKIAAASMDYYYEQMRALKENQLAITSAWLYGYGTTKQGWRTVFKQNPSVKVSPSQTVGKLKRFFTGTPSMEEIQTPDYIAEEGPFLYFVNPKDLIFDSEEPFGRGKFLHHNLKRSLYDVKTSGLYSLEDNFYLQFKRQKDERECMLDLYESWIWHKDGLYVFVYCDGWHQPLRYDKIPYASEGFPFKILTLTDQVNRVYPVPHAKIAQRLQRLNDYILTLQKEAIEKYRDIMVWDENSFDPDERTKIRKGEIGTNVFSKNKTPAMAGQHFGGANIPKDLYAMQEIISANIKEILSVVGAKLTGESEVETLGQEKIGEFGNQLRMMGMQLPIREFLISQGRKLLQDIKQFGTAPALFKVTGLDLVDKVTKRLVTEKWVEFATDNSAEMLKDIIPQELDIDVDVTNKANRDLPVIRKQLSEAITLLSSEVVQIALAKEGKQVRLTELIKKLLENFETIDNPEQYVEEITPGEEGQEGVTPIPGAEGQAPGPGVTPEAIEAGIQPQRPVI